jgi:hypothetical protein
LLPVHLFQQFIRPPQMRDDDAASNYKRHVERLLIRSRDHGANGSRSRVARAPRREMPTNECMQSRTQRNKIRRLVSILPAIAL